MRRNGGTGPGRPRTNPGRRYLLALVTTAAAAVAGCAGAPARDGALEEFFATYRGSFASAATENPADDLNFNPCDGAEAPCQRHSAPLQDILLELDGGHGDSVRLRFFRSRSEQAAGQALDLLGAGCGTTVGPATGVESHRQDASVRYTLSFPLTADNRLCLGKLRPTSRHHLAVELHRNAETGRHLQVNLDKRVSDANYLYVVENGVRRRVKIDLNNTVGESGERRYRVCIENDLGEYERCVLTDREFRSVALPVPLPGGAGVTYTWWQALQPDLRRTKGRYDLEQYTGRFEPVQ